MLETLPVMMAVGTALGFLSGLGIGGGSLLIVWLTAVLGTDPQTARTVNLLFFIPSALVVCILRIRQKKLQIRPLLPAIVAGCAAAAVFSWIGGHIHVTLLRKLFGMILLAAGVREVLWHSNEKGSSG